MDAFERLYAIATGPGDALALARRLIGTDRLALALAKFGLAETTLRISPADVADILEIDRVTAKRRLDAIGPHENLSNENSAS